MKLHLDRFGNQNAFTGYGEGYVLINQQRFERSLIVLPDRIIADWAPRRVEELTAADSALLADLPADILLLGTGRRLCFPPAPLLQALTTRGIGMEVMDSHAAARTYNILLAEGRRVAAALLL
ncbi:MAG: Mth938-like domain-containing protein [Burkholderiales bacterium]|nr:Mth938-like domain-containing protein [Burkholderiales bacterium]